MRCWSNLDSCHCLYVVISKKSSCRLGVSLVKQLIIELYQQFNQKAHTSHNFLVAVSIVIAYQTIY